MRNQYRVTVFLSNDFRRTSDLAYGFATEGEPDSYDRAAADGVWDGDGFAFEVYAADAADAAELAWAVTNSYPTEMHCSSVYADEVAAYRAGGRRSMSMGDLVRVEAVPGEGGGRYVAARVGFDYLDEES